MKGKNKSSNLHIQKGVPQPSAVNRNYKRKKRRQRTLSEYVEAILKGDRVALGQAITLIESANPTHQILAQQIIEACLPHAERSIRLGITGTPGVGKSTFIESLGMYLITGIGKKLAVLAVDPTSQMTKGSILGDKTRMANLSVHQNAFIRPSAAGDSLGGVARKTRETVILCEAAGYDTIIIETVGVGQSETAVHSMVDFFLLLLLPGAGDELQGIKRGIVEMADMIAINKADGNNLQRAKMARQEYKNALHLFPPKESGWIARAMICSALSKLGIEDIWQKIEGYTELTQESGYFKKHRANQAKYWLQESIQGQLKQLFEHHEAVKTQLPTIEKAVLNHEISSFQAAKILLDLFLSKK